MKAKLLPVALSCLLLFSLSGYAQQLPPNFAELRQAPLTQQSMKIGMKTALRSFWDGNGRGLMTVGFLALPEFRQALNVSDEQYQEIQNAQMGLGAGLQDEPEFQEIMAEMQAIATPDDPLMYNADEETLNKFIGIQERMVSMVINHQADAIDSLLTPEQKDKTATALLANMGEMPIVSPDLFEILDLTDEQREQMEAIKKELEPEFEQYLEEFVNASVIIANKMFDEFEKQGMLDDLSHLSGGQQKIAEFQEKAQALGKKMAAENPEFKRLQDEMNTKGKTFATQFQTKMFDVLNDEQWARLQELTDNPPEFAKVLREKLKEQRDAAETMGGWQPGPNSWKPGDPIPEQYRQERKTRRGFPREE